MHGSIENAAAKGGALNPVVFSLMDDGCPNCADIESLPIWDVEPIARAVIAHVREIVQSVCIGQSSGDRRMDMEPELQNPL
jgi:hypothetical protein